MGEELNYFAILGIALDATPDEIGRAYRRKAKNLHPDVLTNASPADKARVEEAFKKLEEAYYILSDKNRRRTYIRTLPPLLLFDPPLVDFGDIRAGDPPKRIAVQIRNIGGPPRTETFSPPGNGRFWSIYSSAPSKEELRADPHLLYNFYLESEVDPNLEPEQYTPIVYCFFGGDSAELHIRANILAGTTDTTTAAGTSQPEEMLEPSIESLKQIRKELDLVPVSVARILHLGDLVRRSVIENEDGDWLHINDVQFMDARGVVVAQGDVNWHVQDIFTRTDLNHWLLDAQEQAECEEILRAKLLSSDHTSPKREAERHEALLRTGKIYEEPVGEGLREYDRSSEYRQSLYGGRDRYYSTIDWKGIESKVLVKFGSSSIKSDLLREVFHFIELNDRKVILRLILDGYSVEAEGGLRIMLSRFLGGVQPDRSFRKRWRKDFRESWLEVLSQTLVNVMKKFDAARTGMWRDNVSDETAEHICNLYSGERPKLSPGYSPISSTSRARVEASAMEALAPAKLDALARASLHEELLKAKRADVHSHPMFAELDISRVRSFSSDQEPVTSSHLKYLRDKSLEGKHGYLGLVYALFETHSGNHYVPGVEAQRWFEREGWFARGEFEEWASVTSLGERERFNSAFYGLEYAAVLRVGALIRGVFVDSSIRQTMPKWVVRDLIDSGRLKPRSARG